MKIELSQSGGYAGETITLKKLSGDKIPEAAKAKLEALLGASDFFNLKNIDVPNEIGADMLTYTLKISNSKKQSNEISFGDTIDHSSFSKLVTLIKSL